MQIHAPGFSRHRTIACLGFDWRAEVSLRETLALIGGKTLDSWQFSNDLGADVVVYDVHNALAQALLRRSIAEGEARVMISSTPDGQSDLTLGYPFGASRLIHCLNVASARLHGAKTAAESEHRTNTCQHLDELLRSPRIEDVVVKASKQTGLIRKSEHAFYWPAKLDVDEAAHLFSSDIHLVPARDEESREIQRAATDVVPLEGILWTFGMTRSNGALLRRLDPQRIYRLRRWPDFGLIGRRSSDMRLASLLAQRNFSPKLLAQASAIPPTIVGNFLNSAALCGLLEEQAQPQAAQATAPQVPAFKPIPDDSLFVGVIKRIRSAFALN
jgi:hypothetical protein